MFGRFEVREFRLTKARDIGSCTTIGRKLDLHGGLGGEADQVARPAGDVTCLTCAQPKSKISTHNNLKLTQSANRTTTDSKPFTPGELLRPISSFALCTFLISSALTGCVTHGRLANQERRVLASQIKLLERVLEERKSPELLKKLRADDDVWTAEVHLRDAIDAELKAAEELKLSNANH